MKIPTFWTAWLFLFCFLVTEFGWSGACCGSGARFPGYIDTQASQQFSYLLEFNDFVYEYVSPSGTWYPNQQGLSIVTHRFEFSKWISQNWQSGIAIPFLQRHSVRGDSQGLGDLQWTQGYLWEPYEVVIFAQLSLPTGQNRYAGSLLEARGRGQWALALGYQKSHRHLAWDMVHSAQFQYLLGQTFARPEGSYQVGDSQAFSGLLGMGYTLSPFRLGAQLLYFYQNSSTLRYQGSSNISQPESFTNLSFNLSWSQTADTQWIAQWTDQTLLGHPSNTNLGWISSVQWIRTW